MNIRFPIVALALTFAVLPVGTTSRARFPPRDASSLRGRLFRNDLQVAADGRRTLRFTDVTETSGIAASGYGMRVATGDYNDDGCIDLYGRPRIQSAQTL